MRLAVVSAVVLSTTAMVLFLLIVNRLLLDFDPETDQFFLPETAEIA
jgi:hypothetical protein